MSKRHLHKDYSTGYCGRDISYLRATHEPSEATCASCLKQFKKSKAVNA